MSFPSGLSCTPARSGLPNRSARGIRGVLAAALAARVDAANPDTRVTPINKVRSDLLTNMVRSFPGNMCTFLPAADADWLWADAAKRSVDCTRQKAAQAELYVFGQDRTFGGKTAPLGQKPQHAPIARNCSVDGAVRLGVAWSQVGGMVKPRYSEAPPCVPTLPRLTTKN